jgi:hypothetical protein
MDKCPTCGQDTRVLRRDIDGLCIVGLGLIAFLAAMGTGVNIWLSVLAYIVGSLVGSGIAVALERQRSKLLSKTTH